MIDLSQATSYCDLSELAIPSWKESIFTAKRKANLGTRIRTDDKQQWLVMNVLILLCF